MTLPVDTVDLEVKIKHLFPVTNAELAEAIEVAHNKIRATTPVESIHHEWKDHLNCLLAVQRKRADKEEL